MNAKLEASFTANKSFHNPLITYFIIRCLKASHYETEEHPVGIIFSHVGAIQQLLSRLIYAARLYTVAYLSHLSENNAVDKWGGIRRCEWSDGGRGQASDLVTTGGHDTSPISSCPRNTEL